MKQQTVKPWLLGIARIGFAGKGSVYALIGGLAMGLAIGYGSEDSDLRGAVDTLAKQPFGAGLLILLAFGMLNFGLWKTVQSVWDPERISTDWIGWGIRLLAGLSALLHFFLTWKIIGDVLGHAWSGGGGDEAVQSWTSTALGMPAGRWLVLGAATVVAGVAVANIVRLVRTRFMDQFGQEQMGAQENLVVKIAARLGFVGRTIVIILVAWFLWRAGITADPDEAGGMPKALSTLLAQPYGRWLVGFTATGLFSQGVYIWLMVPYRKIHMRRDTDEWQKTWHRVTQ